MSGYKEKKEKLIEKISYCEKRISELTEKKRILTDKLKNITWLALAEEYDCKPDELDAIIAKEHEIVQKLNIKPMQNCNFPEHKEVKF